jgi:hypothetical protein
MHLEIFGGKCASSMKKCIFISLENCFCEFFEITFDCTCALADQSRNAGTHTSIIVSVQVIAEQLFHSVFLAAYYPELVLTVCMWDSNFSNAICRKASGTRPVVYLIDFERKHSSSVVRMPAS